MLHIATHFVQKYTNSIYDSSDDIIMFIYISINITHCLATVCRNWCKKQLSVSKRCIYHFHQVILLCHFNILTGITSFSQLEYKISSCFTKLHQLCWIDIFTRVHQCDGGIMALIYPGLLLLIWQCNTREFGAWLFLLQWRNKS